MQNFAAVICESLNPPHPLSVLHTHTHTHTHTHNTSQNVALDPKRRHLLEEGLSPRLQGSCSGWVSRVSQSEKHSHTRSVFLSPSTKSAEARTFQIRLLEGFRLSSLLCRRVALSFSPSAKSAEARTFQIHLLEGFRLSSLLCRRVALHQGALCVSVWRLWVGKQVPEGPSTGRKHEWVPPLCAEDFSN